MENVKQAKGLECYQYERTIPCHHDVILPLALVTSGPPFPSLRNKPSIHLLVTFVLSILCNGPLTSPSPWYSCAMHAIPPCLLTIMMMDLFASRHHHHPSSLHMFYSLYHIVLQRLLPSFSYMHAPVVKCSHNNSHFSPMPSSLINCIDTITTCASTTPYLGACIAQFESLTLLVVITCRRSYLYLASLDA